MSTFPDGLEIERAFALWPFSSDCFKSIVITSKRSRVELDGFARLDLEAALHRTHGHDAAFHRHAVDFEAAGNRRGPGDQPVGRRALVGERHVAAGDRRALGCRARPWIADLDRPGGEIFCRWR